VEGKALKIPCRRGDLQMRHIIIYMTILQEAMS
jgi:hypothetical protein